VHPPAAGGTFLFRQEKGSEHSNPDRFSLLATRQYGVKSLDNTNEYCLRDFSCLAKPPAVRTAVHLSARYFREILSENDAALLTQGKEAEVKSTEKGR